MNTLSLVVMRCFLLPLSLPVFLSLLNYLAFFFLLVCKLSNLSKLAQNLYLSRKFQLCINN